MASPITWRDIRAPDFGRANSLIAGATNTFNNAFTGIDKLQEAQNAAIAQQQLESQQAAANNVFGQVLGGANPNDINPSFAGLGAQGADVAKFLQDSRNSYFSNQGTQADTIGQQNDNTVFFDNNDNTQAGVKATTAVDTNRATGIGIDNKTRGTINEQTIQKNDQELVGGAIKNELDAGKLGLFNKFGEINAQSDSTILGNKANDSNTFTNQYKQQLEGARKLTGAQTQQGLAGAALKLEQANVVQQDSDTRKYTSRSGRISANASATRSKNSGGGNSSSSNGGNFSLALAKVNQQLKAENLKQGTNAYAERGRQLLSGFTGGSTAAALQNSLFSVNKVTRSNSKSKFKVPEFTTGNGLDGLDTGEFNKLGDLINTGGTFKDSLGITREFISKDARAAAGRELKNLNAKKKDDIFYTFNSGIKAELDTIRQKYTQPRVDKTTTNVAPPKPKPQTVAKKAKTKQVLAAVLNALKARQ